MKRCNCNNIVCDCKDGVEGFSGLKGPNGVKGIPGNNGLKGPKGNIGNIGPEGLPGIEGVIGITGIGGTSTIVGPPGPPGPPGLNGLDGLDGNTGSIGIEGLRGSDIPNFHVGFTGTTITHTPPYITTGNVNKGRWILNVGASSKFWLRFVGSWLTITPVIGDVIEIVSKIDNGEWSIEIMNGQKIQMLGIQSNVGFSNVIGSNTSDPGSPRIVLQPSNYGDCFSFIYIGDDEWLLLKASVANDLLPTFIN